MSNKTLVVGCWFTPPLPVANTPNSAQELSSIIYLLDRTLDDSMSLFEVASSGILWVTSGGRYRHASGVSCSCCSSFHQKAGSTHAALPGHLPLTNLIRGRDLLVCLGQWREDVERWTTSGMCCDQNVEGGGLLAWKILWGPTLFSPELMLFDAIHYRVSSWRSVLDSSLFNDVSFLWGDWLIPKLYVQSHQPPAMFHHFSLALHGRKSPKKDRSTVNTD